MLWFGVIGCHSLNFALLARGAAIANVTVGAEAGGGVDGKVMRCGFICLVNVWLHSVPYLALSYQHGYGIHVDRCLPVFVPWPVTPKMSR